MTDLDPAEYAAMKRAMLPENRDIAMRSPRLGFQAGWVAARGYYANEFDEATQELAQELADARHEANQAEQRERALRTMLEARRDD